MSVIVDRSHAQVTIISLNRPDKRNALSIELLESLCSAVDETVAIEDQRVLIIRGEGPAFCAGLDLIEGRDPEMAERSAELVERMLHTVYHCPLVSIALVHGAAVAGGAGLMSACDFVLATPNAKFGYPETRRGLVAGLVMTFLKRQLRERDARELLLLAGFIDSERALAMGLINRVIPDEALMHTALKWAKAIIKSAPGATARTKQLLDAVYGKPLAEDLSLAQSHHIEMRGTAEAAEGMAAFAEKREPRW